METITPEQERLLNYLYKILLEIRGITKDETIPESQRAEVAIRRNGILAEFYLI